MTFMLPFSSLLACAQFFISARQEVDKSTLAMQAVVFPLLAISLVARLGWGLPHYNVAERYLSVLGPSVNYAILGVGQAMLYYIAGSTSRDELAMTAGLDQRLLLSRELR